MAAVLTNIESTTVRHQFEGLRDAFYNAHVILKYFYEKKKVITGGDKVTSGTEYGEAGYGGTYSGDSVHRTGVKQFIGLPELDYARYYYTLLFTREEMQKNRGPERKIDLYTKKFENARKSLTKMATQGLFDDGTKDYGDGIVKGIVGLKAAVLDSNTYAGIDRSAYSWWQAVVDSSSTVLTEDLARKMTLDCSDGNEVYPDLCVTTKTLWRNLRNRITGYGRYQAPVNGDVLKWGFPNFTIDNVTYVWDAECTSTYAYWLNFDFLEFVIPPDGDFWKSDITEPYNQAVRAIKIYLDCQLFNTNPRWSGVCSALTS